MANGDEESSEEIQPLEVEDEAEDADGDWGGPGIETIEIRIDWIGIEVREPGADGPEPTFQRPKDRADPELDRLMGWGEDSGDFGTSFDSMWRM